MPIDNEINTLIEKYGRMTEVLQYKLRHKSDDVQIMLYLFTHADSWTIYKTKVISDTTRTLYAVEECFKRLRELQVLGQITIKFNGIEGAREYYTVSNTERSEQWFWKYSVDAFKNTPVAIIQYMETLEAKPGDTLELVASQTSSLTRSEMFVIPLDIYDHKNDKQKQSLTIIDDTIEEESEEEEIAEVTPTLEPTKKKEKTAPVILEPVPELPSNKDKKKKEERDRCEEVIKECKMNEQTAKYFRSFKLKTRNEVEEIYLVWNLCKDAAPENLVKYDDNDKTETKVRWKKHNSLSRDMISVITRTLNAYSCEDMCQAIDNVARTLFSPDTYYTKTWDLAKFFKTGVDSSKTSDRRWWQWMTEAYDFQRYVSRDRTKGAKDAQEREDRKERKKAQRPSNRYVSAAQEPLQELMLIAYRKELQSQEYTPISKNDIEDFRLGAVNLKDFFDRRPSAKYSEEEQVRILFKVIDKEYLRSGKLSLSPWMLAHLSTWTEYMPAYNKA